MRLTAAQVAAWTGGDLVGDDVDVDGVSIDSRELSPGQLFVPIVAGRDGHDFIAQARANGASLHLTAQDPVESPAVVVDDTADALSRLASVARSRLPDTVVGITGSVGKTTAKDLLAAALSTTLRTAWSHRSHNNEIGVPLTVLNTPDDAEAVVVEMGARGIGHIAHLCAIARPTIGIVTTVGQAHTELFGGLAEVVLAKGELVEALPGSGVAVLNADVPEVAGMAHRTEARVLTFGHDPTADVVAESVRLDEHLAARFVLHSPWGHAEVHLGVPGEHQVANALAAASAALVAGVPVDAVAEGLADARLSPWRMDLQRRSDGLLVLNDAYNANPTSMAAALRSLAVLPAERHVAVLGYMAELGADSEEAHLEIARLATSLGLHVVAVEAPQYGPEVVHVPDRDAALQALGETGAGVAVLVKGSRVAGLEAVAHHLLGDDA